MTTVLKHEHSKKEKIQDQVNHILDEARMVLPGIQALLGFQLVAVFNATFAKISYSDQLLHLLAILLSVNAICFLITPAAIHRQGHPALISQTFADTSSKLISLGMMPLLLSIVIDSYVVANIVTKQSHWSIAIASALLLEFVFCWIMLPQLKRHASRAEEQDNE